VGTGIFFIFSQGPDPASYPMGTWGYFSADKVAGA